MTDEPLGSQPPNLRWYPNPPITVKENTIKICNDGNPKHLARISGACAICSFVCYPVSLIDGVDAGCACLGHLTREQPQQSTNAALFHIFLLLLRAPALGSILPPPRRGRRLLAPFSVLCLFPLLPLLFSGVVLALIASRFVAVRFSGPRLHVSRTSRKLMLDAGSSRW